MTLKQFALTMTVIVMGYASSSFAEGCDDLYNSNPGACYTAGAAGAAAVGSGIKSGVTYFHANKFNESHTKEIGKQSKPVVPSSSQIANWERSIGDGDRIEIIYNLNEAQNRTHHLSVLQSEIDSAKSSASSNRMYAVNALMPKTVQEYDSSSKTYKSVVKGPDLMAYAYYNSVASNFDDQAEKIMREKFAAERGGPVPTYDFPKTIDVPENTGNVTKEFLVKMQNEGSRLSKMTQMPAAKFAQYRKMINTGRMGIAGVVVGGAVAVEEFVAGKIAQGVGAAANSDVVNSIYGAKN